MSIFDDEIANGLGAIAAEVGRTILLQRRSSSVSILAVPGSTKSLVNTSEGARLMLRERDYIIRADLYRFPGDPDCTRPLPGDQIVDQGKTYEVTRFGDQLPCWDWSDRGETYLRVHTREVGN